MAVSVPDLLLRFAADGQWTESMAAELTAAIHRELPELAADEDLARETLESTVSVIELFVDRIRRGEPVTSVEPPEAAIVFARDLVQRGQPLDRLLRSYHIGQAAFFERWSTDVRAVLDDPADVAQAIQEVAGLTFAFVRALDSGLVRRWTEERERWVRSSAAVQADAVRSLLAGGGADESAVSELLGYELAHRHTAFVVWRPDGQPDARPGGLDRAASSIADALRGRQRLILPLQGNLYAGWVDGGEDSGLAAVRLPDGASAAIGSSGDGLAGFRRSHREAMDARRVARLSARAPGSIVSYASVAVTALASVDIERARDFVDASLGALAGEDDTSRRLAGTLRAYLEEGMSPRRTARRLGVHENTVTNRVGVVEQRIGGPVGPRATELLVALRLLAVTKRATRHASAIAGEAQSVPR